MIEVNSATHATRTLLSVAQPHPNHNGGQLAFDRAGFLYVGMGDGGSFAGIVGNDPENRAQNMSTLLGKMLRIDPTRAGSTWKMVALGLRNPWRFSFDRKTGDLWIGDVGAGAQEEVDFRPKAQIGALANYGWSRYEGTSVYGLKKPLTKKGKLLFPVWTYSHGIGTLCSIIGGFVYRGAAVPSARGRYFFGDFCLGAVWSFKVGPKGRVGLPGPARRQSAEPLVIRRGRQRRALRDDDRRRALRAALDPGYRDMGLPAAAADYNRTRGSKYACTKSIATLKRTMNAAP